MPAQIDPRKLREAVTLQLQGRSYSQIAKVLGVSVGQIKYWRSLPRWDITAAGIQALDNAIALTEVQSERDSGPPIKIPYRLEANAPAIADYTEKIHNVLDEVLRSAEISKLTHAKAVKAANKALDKQAEIWKNPHNYATENEMAEALVRYTVIAERNTAIAEKQHRMMIRGYDYGLMIQQITDHLNPQKSPSNGA